MINQNYPKKSARKSKAKESAAERTINKISAAERESGGDVERTSRGRSS